MSRWEPNARGRLEAAALELYAERGYERTTVAEIAGRAGLTERTYFRHFADKREVLFGGSEPLREVLVGTLAAACETAAPIEAVAAALDAVAAGFEGQHAHARLRHGVIAANPVLQERELIKLAAWVSALADALRARGTAEPTASLAAEAGIAVFKVAFERWVRGSGEPDLSHLVREAVAELRSVTAPT